MPLSLAFEKQRQVDVSKYEATLVYQVCSRAGRTVI